MELQARWPSPRPSWPWDPPGLHGHSTGWTRAPFQVLGCLALVCFSLVLDDPDSRRSRLRRHRAGRTAGCPAGSLPWSLQVHLTGRSPRLPAALALLVRRTMSRSSFQRSPLHCLGSRGVHVPRARRRDRFGDRSPTRLVCRLRGSSHPGGFLLPDPVRVLHRTSSHGVRDVSSPRQRIPTTHSYPSKLCSLRTADPLRIPPSRGRAPSPFQVSLVGSP